MASQGRSHVRTSVSTQSSRRGWRAWLAARGGVARIPRSILDRLGEDGALGSLHAARDARLDSVLQQRQAPPGATLLPTEDTAMSSVMGEEASIFCKVGARATVARAAPCLFAGGAKPVSRARRRATGGSFRNKSAQSTCRKKPPLETRSCTDRYWYLRREARYR